MDKVYSSLRTCHSKIQKYRDRRQSNIKVSACDEKSRRASLFAVVIVVDVDVVDTLLVDVIGKDVVVVVVVVVEVDDAELPLVVVTEVVVVVVVVVVIGAKVLH